MSSIKLAKLNDHPEIFYSLQGEGLNIGLPSVFIRSSLCNLHCSWCDTPYTWNWEGSPWKHKEPEKFSKEECIIEVDTLAVVNLVAHYQALNVVITGGEPLLQQAAWHAIISQLRSINPRYTFEVETNGTQIPSADLAESVTQWNVSPKLSNSNNPADLRRNEKAMQFFASSPAAWFKFVIQSQEDLTELQQLEKEWNLPKSQILLMPEGSDPETLRKRRLWLADRCLKEGYRFSDRLHVQLWGNKRGI